MLKKNLQFAISLFFSLLQISTISSSNISWVDEITGNQNGVIDFTELGRRNQVKKGLNLSGVGLEIAPLFRPQIWKKENKVFYTDYISTTELRKKNIGNPGLPTGNVEVDVVDIDFIWQPGKKLRDCVQSDLKFDYVVASHVIEHVPNVIGWILEIMDVLKPGGILSLIVPDKRFCFDMYRSETEVADLIEAWIINLDKPSPRQIYDCLQHAVEVSDFPGREAFKNAPTFAQSNRLYTDEQALHYAISSWKSQTYLDVHCSAFNPQSFQELFKTLNRLGIINASVSESFESTAEFFVQITKLGEPTMEPPTQEESSKCSLKKAKRTK